ncbi:hypothetical protein [Nostoc sp. WHI]|nr:hypothetical protein [Nostoc sp. WHI]
MTRPNQKPDCTLSCNRGCDREAKIRGRSPIAVGWVESPKPNNTVGLY